LPKLTDFIVTFDTSVCGFAVDVRDSTGTGLGGIPVDSTDSTNLSDTAWQFSADSIPLNGPIDNALVTIDSSTGNLYLVVVGSTAATGDSILLISVPAPGGIIIPGTYNTNTGSAFYFSDFTTAQLIYAADSATAGLNVTITIGYDDTTKIVTGTFNGTANDVLGNIIDISNGSFRAKLTE
jgi:hypothetical protein